ncbi:hypothetical protein KJ068_00860 [bacterium]|nr:hypothetical protein [bacterium]
MSPKQQYKKKAYQRPKFVTYGTIQQITRMTAADGRLDNATQGRLNFTRLQ